MQLMNSPTKFSKLSFRITFNFPDIDDCANHTCGNGGSCVDGVNSFSCSCAAGYTGNHCETGRSRQ